LQLWPGQFVNARLLLDTLEQVVVVPTSAVQRGPEGTFVYVVGADNKATVRSITVAQQDEATVVIGKGLTPTDLVVTTGFARLKAGAEVTVSGPDADKPAAGADAIAPQANADPTAAGSTSSINAVTREPLTGQPGQEGRRKRRDGQRTGDGKRGPRREAATPPGATQ
jgi:multidrug efflux system membrane fusion protein